MTILDFNLETHLAFIVGVPRVSVNVLLDHTNHKKVSMKVLGVLRFYWDYLDKGETRSYYYKKHTAVRRKLKGATKSRFESSHLLIRINREPLRNQDGRQEIKRKSMRLIRFEINAIKDSGASKQMETQTVDTCSGVRCQD